MKRAWLLTVLGGMCLLAIGCGSGSSTASVSGNVTIGGKPIPGDTEAGITFFKDVAEGEDIKVSVPITDGHYESPETPTGDVRAFISVTRLGPPKMNKRLNMETRETISLVPGKYDTGIPVQIDGDTTDQNFDL